MNWQRIKELNKMGFEVANHTRTHAAVSKSSKAQFMEELNYNEDKCYSLGIEKPSNFAYRGYDISLLVMDVLPEKIY